MGEGDLRGDGLQEDPGAEGCSLGLHSPIRTLPFGVSDSGTFILLFEGLALVAVMRLDRAVRGSRRQKQGGQLGDHCWDPGERTGLKQARG